MLQKAASESVLAASIHLTSFRFTSPAALATHDRGTCASPGSGCAQVTDCPVKLFLIFACLKGMATKQLVRPAPEEAGGIPARLHQDRQQQGPLGSLCPEWGAPGHECWQTKGCCFCLPWHTSTRCLLWHVSTRPLTQTRDAAAGLPAAGFGWKSQEPSLHKHLGAFQPTGMHLSA